MVFSFPIKDYAKDLELLISLHGDPIITDPMPFDYEDMGASKNRHCLEISTSHQQ